MGAFQRQFKRKMALFYTEIPVFFRPRWLRRGGRAVECNGLENRRGLTPTVGSNPTPSAIYRRSHGTPLRKFAGCSADEAAFCREGTNVRNS